MVCRASNATSKHKTTFLATPLRCNAVMTKATTSSARNAVKGVTAAGTNSVCSSLICIGAPSNTGRSSPVLSFSRKASPHTSVMMNGASLV